MSLQPIASKLVKEIALFGISASSPPPCATSGGRVEQVGRLGGLLIAP
jgi:hypothetical protein